MKRRDEHNNMIIKISQVREYLKKFDKQVSTEFLEDFNTLVRELLVLIVLRSNKNKKRLSAKDVMMIKRALNHCFKEYYKELQKEESNKKSRDNNKD